MRVMVTIFVSALAPQLTGETPRKLPQGLSRGGDRLSRTNILVTVCTWSAIGYSRRSERDLEFASSFQAEE